MSLATDIEESCSPGCIATRSCKPASECYVLLGKLLWNPLVPDKTKLRLAADAYLWREPLRVSQTPWDIKMWDLAGWIMEQNALADPLLAASTAANGLRLHEARAEEIPLHALRTILVVAPSLSTPEAIKSGVADRVRLEVENIAESFIASRSVSKFAREEVFPKLPSRVKPPTPTPTEPRKSRVWIWVLLGGVAAAGVGALVASRMR